MTPRKSTTKSLRAVRRKVSIANLVDQLRAAQEQAKMKPQPALAGAAEERRNARIASAEDRAFSQIGRYEARNLEELRRKLDVFFEALGQASGDAWRDIVSGVRRDYVRLLKPRFDPAAWIAAMEAHGYRFELTPNLTGRGYGLGRHDPIRRTGRQPLDLMREGNDPGNARAILDFMVLRHKQDGTWTALEKERKAWRRRVSASPGRRYQQESLQADISRRLSSSL